MSRSAVRAGMFDARDRATKRRRDRRAPMEATAPDHRAALVTWLRARLDDLDDDAVERLDLRAFLRDTAAFDPRPEERLRQLAIWMETRGWLAGSRRSWAAIDRVYQAALKLAPRDPVLHSSRSISAAWIVESHWAEERADHAWLLRESEASILEALAIDPDDPELHYLRANHAYMHRLVSIEEALPLFERVLELDAEHGFARLYRAHCLHDLERFDDAVRAYDQVPKAAFQGLIGWRMDLLVEQRAQCRARAGDLDGARADFERALSRYEREPHLLVGLTDVYRRWAVEGPFPDLAERVALVAQLERLWWERRT